MCVSLHARVTQSRLGFIGSDLFVAHILLQGFSIPPSLCVLVKGWQLVYPWLASSHSALTPPYPSPLSVWEHNGRSGKTIQDQEQGPLESKWHSIPEREALQNEGYLKQEYSILCSSC